MIYAFRIIGYPLVLLLILVATSTRFDETEKTAVILFFLFINTVEALAAVFDFPFKYLRRRRAHLSSWK